MTIKEKIETPYKRFENLGPSALSDAELLAVILRSGTRDDDVYQLAVNVLTSFGGDGRIISLASITYEELMTVKGIGRVKAMSIECVVELSRRLAMQEKRTRLNLDNPASIADYFMEEVRHLEVENVLLLLLDTKSRLIGVENLSSGTVNSSLVSAREIFIKALRGHASGIVLVHNHPSGDPTPSGNDIAVTKKVKEAGELIDIPLFDHIIIGDKRYISLKQNGCI